MRNKDLDKSVEKTKKELGDFQTTAEYIINELVDEIATLEDKVDELDNDLQEANDQIKELNEQINDLQSN